MNLYGIKNDNILDDNKIIKLIELFLDKKTTLNYFIHFIGENMQNILINHSLQKIYRRLRDKINNSCIGDITEKFLDFELSGNTGSSENIFLLNLFCYIHRIINKNI